MTVLGAIIEITLLVTHLSFITLILRLADVARTGSIITILLFGSAYLLTVVTRGKTSEVDKNVYRK
ncbi:MAG: hypothetical protein AAFR56_10380 [Chloroflexota bacterium]